MSASTSKGKMVEKKEENKGKVCKKCDFCNQDLSMTQAEIDKHKVTCEKKDKARKAEEERKKKEVEARLEREKKARSSTESSSS